MTGLILKSTNYSEGSKIVTILTPQGKIQATAPGARSLKSAIFSGTQIFAYSEFVLERSKGNLPYVKSCDVIENFYNLRLDVQKLALAVYFADLAEHMAAGDETGDVLRFMLNTLYILQNKSDFEYIKPVFELRLLSLLGFSPCMDNCVLCDSKKKLMFFSVQDSGVVCEACDTGGYVVPDTLSAMRYILSADDRCVFAFSVSAAVLEELSAVCEGLTLIHLEFKPKSLDYYGRL